MTVPADGSGLSSIFSGSRARPVAPPRRAARLCAMPAPSLISARIGLTAPLFTTQAPLHPHHGRAEVRLRQLRAFVSCIAAADVTLRTGAACRPSSAGSWTDHSRLLPVAKQAVGASSSSTSSRCVFEDWQARICRARRAAAGLRADTLRLAGQNGTYRHCARSDAHSAECEPSAPEFSRKTGALSCRCTSLRSTNSMRSTLADSSLNRKGAVKARRSCEKPSHLA